MTTANEWRVKIGAARRRAHDHDTLDCLDELERRLGQPETRETVQSQVSVSNESHRAADETAESQPWIAEGVSRSTYFRRKRLGELKHKHGT